MKSLSIIAISFYFLIGLSLVGSKIRLGSFMKYMKFMKSNVWNKNIKRANNNYSDLVTTTDNSKVQRELRDTEGLEISTLQDFFQGTYLYIHKGRFSRRGGGYKYWQF